jgi:hypothetical protein
MTSGRSTPHHRIRRLAAAAAAALPFLASSVSAQNLSYLKVAGTSFRPRDSAVETVYGGAGCISRGTGVTAFVYGLQLPQASRVKYVRAYFYDASAKNMTFALSRHGGQGTTVDDVSFTSQGDAGYGTALSSELDVAVDNVTYATQLSVVLAEASSSLEFCGMRVAYVADTIFADGFED